MPTQISRRTSFVLTTCSLLLAATTGAVPDARAQGGPTTGPDVTVIYLSTTTSNLGASGGIRAYAIGTTSCNIGDKDVNWCDETNGCSGGNVSLTNAQHPVIAQNLYRLKDGRFLQLGMSWLKHGFVSTNSTDSACKVGHPSCSGTPVGGSQLGVGCTDTYGSGLNSGGGSTCAGGSGCRLGQRSEVNPTTGVYPMPYTNVPHPLSIDQRIQVPEVEVNPALNPGATYWIEGQYVSDNDAQAGNGLNNASYRLVAFGASPNFNMTPAGNQSSTVREKTALYAWKAADPAVEIFNADFCSAPLERFEVARKVTGTGPWHYEYVVRNLNSDHAAQAFSVDFPANTAITNVGFYDVDSHSGEPYSTTDWTSSVDAPNGTVRWETESWASNNNANALRWATMYSFWFDADADPATAQHAVDLFKPLPEAIANAGDDVAVCPGGSVQIGAAPVAGQTYLWSPGGETASQISVSPATQTVYTLTATNRCDSSQDTVTVSVATAPDAPTLVSPASGATGLQPPVALSWSAVAGADDYTVEVATDAGFANVIASATVAATNTQVGSLSAQQYFWRVTANAACSSVPSAAFNFSVASGIFSDGFVSGDSTAWSAIVP
jgi:hypothetical protein